jgi:toxin-antitoxin system PIN domain toxin
VPRVLADVNVWLATIVEQHPHHSAAVSWWRNQILPARGTVCFCRLSQLGLLRLLTNETVMGASRRTTEQAWRDYEQLVAQPAVEYLDEPSGLATLLRSHTGGQERSTNLWTDAYLAAFAEAGDVELATFDRGFRRFAGLRLRSLA